VARMQMVVSNFARDNDERIFAILGATNDCAGINCDVFHHIRGTQTSSSHLPVPGETFLAWKAQKQTAISLIAVPPRLDSRDAATAAPNLHSVPV
jgi:hypothetical protein